MAILYSLFIFFPVFLFSKNVVITSVYPLKLFLKEITPANIKVYNIIPANANPHLFEPEPNKIKIIEEADVFIGIQKDFDGWIEKNLQPNAISFFLNKINSNPHIWLSPVFMLNKTDKIVKILVKKFPDYKNIIIKKSKLFKKKLIIVISKYENKFKNLKNKNIVEIHPAFDYLAKDFNLNICGVLFYSEHQETSLKHYIKFIKEAKKNNVKVILYSANLHIQIINNIKKDLHAEIVKINPLATDKKNYINFISRILEKIYSSLNNI